MVPRFDSFMLPYLQFLADKKEHTTPELMEYISTYLNLSEEDKAERTRKGSVTKVYDRTQWSGTYLRQARLVEAVGRGIYKIAQRGLDLLATHPHAINIELLSQYEEFVEFQNRRNNNKINKLLQTSNTNVSANSVSTPSEIMEEAYNDLSNDLADQLLAEVKKQSPLFFEKLVIKLLVAMGYGGSFEDAASVTKYSHDEGIDGVIKEDKLGLDCIYIQAKRYDSNPVGRKEIQSFVGALSGKGATKGIFITTSTFTKEALSFKSSTHKIVLIDGTQLAQLMIDYNIGVSVRQTFEIKKVDSDFFIEQ